MDPLNVCLMNDSFPPIIDGVANAVVNYASNIQKSGGHALVVTPSYPGADDSKWPFEVIRYASIDVRKLTTGYTVGIPFSPEVSGQFVKRKMDIIHTHCPMTSAYLARAVHKRADVPLIMTYHTKYDIDIANVVKSKALQSTGIKAVVTNATACDDVWVVSKGAGENLRSLGYRGDYIVMPNGVDLPRGRADDALIAQAVGEYDLPADVPVFLFAGRLMWYKGLMIILNAMKKLKESGRDFRMVIVGDGGDGEDIRAYAKRMGLTDKVIFTGVVSKRELLRGWYSRADLFLFPSTFDSNGLVVREAAACSLPSVLIQDSCAAEGVSDGHNAFLIRESAASMFRKLEELMDHRDYMRQVGEHAAEELYLSWEDAVGRAMERYHEVIELYKSGAFHEKATFSDNLFATQGDLMYTVAKVGSALNQGKLIAQYYFKSMDSGSKKRTAGGYRKRSGTSDGTTEEQSRSSSGFSGAYRRAARNASMIETGNPVKKHEKKHKKVKTAGKAGIGKKTRRP